MKILKKEDYSKWSYKCHCYMCRSDLEAESGDIYHKISKKSGSDPRDPGDSYSYMGNTYYVSCPVCSNEITLDENKIPHVLRQQAQKRKKSKSYIDDDK